MVFEVMHIGITVSNMEQSIGFYRDILKLKFQGELIMHGKETDLLFAKDNCKVRVAYFNGSDEVMAPPIELIQFMNEEIIKDAPKIDKNSISEICFRVVNLDDFYQYLLAHNIECLSQPQEFDFRDYGFGRSKAFYFKDPDGIILEAMESLGN